MSGLTGTSTKEQMAAAGSGTGGRDRLAALNENEQSLALNPPNGAVTDWGGFGYSLKSPSNPNGPAKGDGVTNDDAPITSWLAAGNNLLAPIGTYITSGFVLPVSPGGNYKRLTGAGMGLTIFKANGAVDVLTFGVGALNVELSQFTIDGANLANHGEYAPANSAVQSRHRDIEIVNCTGTPGTAFEAVNSSYSMDWRRVKINSNNIALRLTKAVQNSHFWGCMISGQLVASVILGDGISTLSGPIGFHGCDIEHLAGAGDQDGILAQGVQPLVIDDDYFESPRAGSTCLRLSSAIPTNAVINGMFGAGAAVCPNPIVVDAAAAGSTVSLDGYQFNGYTGGPVLDNSTGSAVTVFPGRNSGGLTSMSFSQLVNINHRLLVAPPSGAATPLVQINAPTGMTGTIFAAQLNAVNRLTVTDQGLVNAKTPGNAGGFQQTNSSGSGIAYWGNTNNFGHNFQQGVAGSATDLFRIDQFGHLQAPFSGVPASSALGTNVTSVTPTGNDTGGSIAIVMSGALAANTKIATLTWAHTFGTSPPRFIALINQTSGAGLAVVNFYATPSTGVSYDLFCNQALAAGTYTLIYFAVGAMAS